MNITKQALRHIIRHEDLTASEKIILEVMADDYSFYAKEVDGKVITHYAPSIERLAHETKCGNMTVKRSLAKLEELGYIKAVSKKRGCATWWFVDIARLIEEAKEYAAKHKEERARMLLEEAMQFEATAKEAVEEVVEEVVVEAPQKAVEEVVVEEVAEVVEEVEVVTEPIVEAPVAIVKPVAKPSIRPVVKPVVSANEFVDSHTGEVREILW